MTRTKARAKAKTRPIEFREEPAPIGPPENKAAKSRDVFVFMINGFKPKAPTAAMALIERVGGR